MRFANLKVAASALVAGSLLVGVARASVVSLPPGNYDDPNPSDPFEGATGGTVTGVQLYPTFSLNDLFGAVTPGCCEPGHTIFNGAGQTTFTFTTASPVWIGGYDLYLSGGGGDGRELSSFELLANLGSGFVPLGVGAQTITDANYGGGAGGQVLVSDTFAPIHASSYEVILDNASLHNLGGRLTELDAITPEPTSIMLLAIGAPSLLLAARRHRKV